MAPCRNRLRWESFAKVYALAKLLSSRTSRYLSRAQGLKGVVPGGRLAHASVPNRSLRTKWVLLLHVQDLAAFVNPDGRFRVVGAGFDLGPAVCSYLRIPVSAFFAGCSRGLD